jgi:hypothetical protein
MNQIGFKAPIGVQPDSGWNTATGINALDGLEAMVRNPSVTRVFIFAEPFPNAGGRQGLHNVHQNQGDPVGGDHDFEDAIWQDGIIVVQLSNGRLCGFMVKFLAQSYETVIWPSLPSVAGIWPSLVSVASFHVFLILPFPNLLQLVHLGPSRYRFLACKQRLPSVSRIRPRCEIFSSAIACNDVALTQSLITSLEYSRNMNRYTGMELLGALRIRVFSHLFLLFNFHQYYNQYPLLCCPLLGQLEPELIFSLSTF